MKLPRINIPPAFARLAFGLGLMLAITNHGTWVGYVGAFLIGLGAAADWSKQDLVVNYNYQARFSTEVPMMTPKKRKK